MFTTKARISLEREPATEAAKALTGAIVDIMVPYMPTARTIGPGRRRTLASTAGRIIGGLLRLEDGEPVNAQRGKAGDMWQHAPVGFDAFWTATDALIAAGVVGTQRGVKGPPGFGGWQGLPTRLWPTERLRRLAIEHGISVDNATEHWALSAETQTRPQPIRFDDLVTIVPMQDWTVPVSLKCDDATLGGMRRQVARVNDHVARASFSGMVFPVFARRFKGAWRLGGRLYALGGETFQNTKRRERGPMRINGERIMSVDATASQLSIFAHLTGMSDRMPADPYAIAGIPRDAVKTFCVQTFGSGMPIQQWGARTAAHVQAFKVAAVRDAVLAVYPAMAHVPAILPADLRAAVPESRLCWAAGQHLVYRESEAIVSAADYAVSYGVPALPLHDALLVPESGVKIAEDAMEGAYYTLIGVRPRIKVEPFDKSA
jgi:hypothetical protein